METVATGVKDHEVMEDCIGVRLGGPFGFNSLRNLSDSSSSFDAAAGADGCGDDNGVNGFEGSGWDPDIVDDAFVDVTSGGTMDGAHDEIACSADAHGFEEDFGFEAADFTENKDAFTKPECCTESFRWVDFEGGSMGGDGFGDKALEFVAECLEVGGGDFGCVFDGEDAVALRYFEDERVEEAGFTCASAAGDEEGGLPVDEEAEEAGGLGCDHVVGGEVGECPGVWSVSSEGEGDAVGGEGVGDGGDAGVVLGEVHV